MRWRTETLSFRHVTFLFCHPSFTIDVTLAQFPVTDPLDDFNAITPDLSLMELQLHHALQI